MAESTSEPDRTPIWNRPGVSEGKLKSVLSDPESALFDEYAAELLESTMDLETVKEYMSLEVLARNYDRIKRQFSRSQSGNRSLNRRHWNKTAEILKEELGIEPAETGDSPGTSGSDLSRSIGRRLRTIREQRGMSQSDVAEKMGCTRQTVSSIERGKREVSLERVNRFARAVDHRADVDFFEDSGFQEQIRVDIDAVLSEMGLEGDIRRLIHSALFHLVDDIIRKRRIDDRNQIYHTLANIAGLMDIEANDAELEYFVGKNLADELKAQYELAEELIPKAAERLKEMVKH